MIVKVNCKTEFSVTLEDQIVHKAGPQVKSIFTDFIKETIYKTTNNNEPTISKVARYYDVEVCCYKASILIEWTEEREIGIQNTLPEASRQSLQSADK